MKMIEARCKIEGLQCTSIEIDLLGKKTLKTSNMLLRNPEKYDGIKAGRYDKDREWSKDVLEKLDALIHAVENDVVLDLFEVSDTRLADLEEDDLVREEIKDKSDPLAFPTLGGSSKTPQV